MEAGEGEWQKLIKRAAQFLEESAAGLAVAPPDLMFDAAKKALQVAEEVFPPDHPAVGKSLRTLSEAYFRDGQYALAVPLQKRALSIMETVLGPEHADVGECLHKLAALCRKTNRIDEAEELEKRAAAIQAEYR